MPRKSPNRIDIDRFRVPAGGKRFRLKDVDPASKHGLPDRERAESEMAADVARIDVLQETMYAQGKHGLLCVFQALDCGGKDGTIRKVFGAVDPIGIVSTSFKTPSAVELAHDYLWRAHKAVPPRGFLGIFNRSHYEECLVVRVHPEILAKQKLPPKLVTKDIWRDRFEDISAMERYLARNGIVILKFFLNVSKEEQRERFLERLEDPAKNWKFSLADIGERKLWDKYQAAYQDLIRHTSTKHAPWHIVPADHKWFARVVIGSAIVSALDKLDLNFPKVDKADRGEFKQVREALLAEEKGAAKVGKAK